LVDESFNNADIMRMPNSVQNTAQKPKKKLATAGQSLTRPSANLISVDTLLANQIMAAKVAEEALKDI
jgi:DNA-binding sugar fermentation-stimulating protein